MMAWLSVKLEMLLDYIMSGETFAILFVWYVIAVFGEVLILLSRRERWISGEILANLFSTIVGSLVQPVFSVGYLFVFVAIYENLRVATIPFSWPGMILCFLLWELCHYIQHRMSHRVALLWAVHSVHHSAQEMNVTVASRKSWFWSIGFEPVYLVLPLIGVSLLQFGVVLLLINLFGILHHSSVFGKFGVFENLLITPANHRVHHGRQPIYVDKNYGQVLAIFDQLFGSFQREEERPDYGLVDKLDTNNPFTFQFAGFRWLAAKVASMDNWRDRGLCLVRPPEWEPGRKFAASALPSVK